MEINPMNYPNDVEVLKDFVEVLEQFGVRYAIGGSIASSYYGKVRFTIDADITVEPFADLAEKIYENLKTRFYISKPAMYQALSSRSSFNIIHLQTSYKIDIFVCEDIAFQRQMLQHPKKVKLSETTDKTFSFVSPEDIILLKLQWYQSTDKTSKKQWDDILGVLTVQKNKLDYDYLKKWASVLQLSELLEKAISETKY
jgi:hypothetical protein